MNKSVPIALTSIFARGRPRPAGYTRRRGRERESLGEIALPFARGSAAPTSGAAKGLTPDEVKARLRSVGPNQVAQEVRHTIIGELVSRSMNPLNLLLLTLAAASYLQAISGSPS